MAIIRSVIAAIVLSASVASAAQFGGLEELSVVGGPQFYQWEEFHGGSKLLREEGWLVEAGVLARLNLVKAEAGSLILTGKATLFGGVVDYDGHTQPTETNATGLPVQTDVTYFGTREELDLGWRFMQQRLSLEPFVGIGSRWWLRDLQDSATTDETGTPVDVSGYTENWHTIYVRLGGRLESQVSDSWRIFAEAGGRFPIYTENVVDISGDDLTIKPRGRWSAFAEAGARYRQLKFSTFYEGFRFDQSPGVRRDGFLYFQPNSESDVFGLRFAWAFK